MESLRRSLRRSAAYRLSRDARLHLRLLREPRRALPNFLVIGVHKGGTTSFYQNLVRHPQIRPALTKEVHYFDRVPMPPIDWYRAHFPAIEELRRENAITGEASPSYAVMPNVPAAVRELVPDCKLIMLLRDPVSRAYSAYQFSEHRNRAGRSFEDWIGRDFDLLGGHRVTGDAFRRLLDGMRSLERLPTGLLRGIYVEQIRNWRKVFPADQLLVLDSAAYFREPAKVLRSVATDTLGLTDHAFVYENTRNDRRPYPKMRDETEATLRAFFAPYNQALYDYLGRDFGW